MKILIPLDGSAMAETALKKAVELAKQNGGTRLVLVGAVDPATLPGCFGAAQVSAINGAAAYLGNVAARLRREGVDLVGRSVWYAAAGPAIVEAAQALKPDLIVMVSGGADRLTPGPIARFVLRETRMPIILVTAEASSETPAGRTIAPEAAMVHG